MRTMLRLTIMVFLIGMASIPYGQASAQNNKPDIAVSTGVLEDIVANIAGDRANVFSIMPAGADPHTWEASPQDMARVAEADGFVSVGAHLEPFVESGGWRRTVVDAGFPELVITDEIELIEVDKVIDHGDHVHDLREGDPHFWLDPNKVIEAIPPIVSYLASIDPDGAAEFTENGERFIAELGELDAELDASFASIPADEQVLVVFHDAYTYFAARYDFEIVGVVIKNPQGEISAQEVVELQGVVRDYDVPAIFAEPQFNTDIVETIIDGRDVEIGILLTDAFAGEVDSYLDLMRFNRDSIMMHLGEQ